LLIAWLSINSETVRSTPSARRARLAPACQRIARQEARVHNPAHEGPRFGAEHRGGAGHPGFLELCDRLYQRGAIGLGERHVANVAEQLTRRLDITCFCWTRRRDFSERSYQSRAAPMPQGDGRDGRTRPIELD
jgi:hypothetical protein